MRTSDTFKLATDRFAHSTEEQQGEILHASAEAHVAETTKRSGGRMLLALSGDKPSSWALHIARQTIRRMKKDVDILVHACGPTLPLLVEDFLLQLNSDGIHCQLTFRHGPMGAEVLAYMRGHENINLVLVDSLANWERDLVDKAPWLKLGCPVVAFDAV
jgi:hypothetical protein